VEFHRTAIQETLGIVSLSNSNRLPLRSSQFEVIPVTLPLGRARLEINPRPTALLPAVITIGIDLVACIKERVTSLPPPATKMNTERDYRDVFPILDFKWISHLDNSIDSRQDIRWNG
jgi:hypothetical protein